MKLVVALGMLAAVPARAAPPPGILGGETLRVDATLELGMSTGLVGKPVALAPDLWYGVTDDLTLGIVHSKFATTGFRGSAGASVCVTPPDAGCPKIYNNVGVEAWAALLRGPLSIGGGGGLEAVNLDLGFYSVKLGFKARASTGRFAFTAMPAIFVAATKRDAMTPNADFLYIPIGLGWRATQTATIALGTGIKGPVTHFADKWQIPGGANISFAIGHVVIGASWVFGALAGAAANPPAPAAPIKGSDVRVIQVWVAYSFGGKSKTRADVPVSFETATEPPAPAWIEVDARPPPTKLPTDGAKVELPKLAQIPQATIDSVAADHGQQLSKCEGTEALRGEVSVAFEIDANGKVMRAELASSTVTNALTPDPKVADCVVHAVKTWQFPKPASGAARGAYTISFQ